MRVSWIALVIGLAAGNLSAQRTYDVSFDGFCDGMNITVSDFAVGGTLTGCLQGLALGNKGIDYGLGPANGGTATLNNVLSSALGPSVVLAYYLDFQRNTWANYLTQDGAIPQLLNHGRFSLGGQPGDGPPSTTPAAAPIPYLPFNRSVTFGFTGYCDGMQLNFAGDLAGGTLTGCLAGSAGGNIGKDFAVQPFGPTGSGIAANIGSSAGTPGALLIYYIDFANKTWANYTNLAGLPGFLNSGTIYFVAPGEALDDSGPPSNR